VVDRYSRLGLSARKGNEVQRVLIERGLVESASISLHGGTAKILALTEEGRQALGLPNAASNRNGGPVHTYWKRRLAEHLRARGYEVTDEYPIGGGKTIDLVATRDGKRIAFEIETGHSDGAANVTKCLNAGIDRVVTVTASRKVKHDLLSSLKGHTHVEVMTGTAAISRSW
jgi:hypothetical protein